MAQPVLYDFPLAYNPAKARLMLLEKSVPFATKTVHLLNGDSLRPAFLQVNPRGSVPVLVDGGKTICESLEIVRYVDESLGNGGPLGGDAVDRTFVEQWSSQVDSWDGNLFLTANSGAAAQSLLSKISAFRQKFARARMAEHPELAEVYEAKLAAMAAEEARGQDAQAIAENERRLTALLDTAETRLKSAGPEEWLAGPAYSAADVLLSVVLFRISMAKLQSRYIDPRAALKAYYARIQQRPSWGKAFGPALSGLNAARLVLPAVLKAWWAGLTNKY